MNLKSALVATAIACAGTAASAVQLGTLENETVAISKSFEAGSGEFSVNYKFHVDGLTSTIFGDLDLGRDGAFWKITDFRLVLKDGGGPVGHDNTPGNGFSFENLIAGDYTLRVFGKVTGTYGGSFTGFMTEISPVPEPGTYALLFAGLGVVGFVARRRRPQQ